MKYEINDPKVVKKINNMTTAKNCLDKTQTYIPFITTGLSVLGGAAFFGSAILGNTIQKTIIKNGTPKK